MPCQVIIVLLQLLLSCFEELCDLVFKDDNVLFSAESVNTSTQINNHFYCMEMAAVFFQKQDIALGKNDTCFQGTLFE